MAKHWVKIKLNPGVILKEYLPYPFSVVCQQLWNWKLSCSLEKSVIELPEEAEASNVDDRHRRFHQCHGKNVTIVNNGKTAFRPNYSEEFNFAIVFSSKPLKNGEPFEVVLEDMIYRWSGSLVIGQSENNCTNIYDTLYKKLFFCMFL